MARTIEEIKQEIGRAYVSNESIKRMYRLQSEIFDNEFSKVGLESMLFYIVAVVIWSLEVLMEQFRGEMRDELQKLHPHTLYWYTDKAKNYQHGYDIPFELPPFEDSYDNTGISAELINNSKIITHASCTKQSNSGLASLRLKVAKRGIDDKLDKLDEDELTGFTAYMNQIQDAGVDLICESKPADRVTMVMTVVLDAKIFDENGIAFVSGADEVRVAVKDYFVQLPFDGLYRKTAHIDYIQKVVGVKAVVITSITATYGGNANTPTITDGYRPDSGWMKFDKDEDLEITYVLDINDTPKS